MSRCKNLRLAETCANCRHMIKRWDYKYGYDFLYYCNVDGDAPTDPDQVLGGSEDEALKIIDTWDEWAKEHDRDDGNVCDAWKAREGVGFHCFGTYGDEAICRVCAYRVECQQASLPRETPELDVPFAGEGDDDEVEA